MKISPAARPTHAHILPIKVKHSGTCPGTMRGQLVNSVRKDGTPRIQLAIRGRLFHRAVSSPALADPLDATADGDAQEDQSRQPLVALMIHRNTQRVVRCDRVTGWVHGEGGNGSTAFRVWRGLLGPIATALADPVDKV